MRFSFCNEGFGPRPWASVCGTIAQAGYDGVEVAPFVLADDVRSIPGPRRADLRRTAHNAGLEVVGLHWLLVKPEGLHIAHPDKAVRGATRDYLCHLADFCADLGGKVMVFGSPRQRGGTADATAEQAWEWAKKTFRGATSTLAERGVTLCIEPLPPKDTDFLNTAAAARRFIEEVDHPNVRLVLDVRAMSSEGRPIPDLLRENVQLLAHVHANDANDQGPGFGEVDFRPILRALRELKYTGYVSVEPFRFEQDAGAVAQQSYRYLEECLGG